MIFSKHVSLHLVIISVLTLALGFYYVYLGFYFGDSSLFRGGLLAAIGGPILIWGQKRIPAQPLHVGLLTIWGVRIPVVIYEGLKILAPFFPWFIDAILIPVGRQTTEFKVPVRARNKNDDGTDEFNVGGQLEVEVSIWWSPDYKAREAGRRMMQYLVTGQASGVNVRLEQAAASIARDIALAHTWMDFISLKAGLSAALAMKIADTQFRKLPRAADDSIPESSLKITGDAYAALPAESNPIAYLDYARGDVEEFKRRTKEIDYFLAQVLENGAGDVINLGIHLEKINIENIEPIGALADAADDPAEEDAQRIAELKDDETNIQRARKRLEAARAAGDEKYSFSDALRDVRVDKGRAREVVVNTTAGAQGGGELTNAAAIMNMNQGG